MVRDIKLTGFVSFQGPEQIHVSKFYKEAKNGFISYLSEDTQTLYETFRKGVIASNNGPCLGWRDTLTAPYQWMNYNETLLRARNFGSGLIGLGLQPRSFIGIYSQNRPEWILLEQGAYCYSLVIVPLYDTLGQDACSFIITQTNMTVVLVEDDIKVNQLLDKCPRTLRTMITVKPIRPATMQRAKNRGLELVTFADVERLGASSSQRHAEVPPQPQDLCTVCYTSGTMGNPKGVMLTHSNVVASISATLLQLGEFRTTYLGRPGLINSIISSFSVEMHKPRVGDVMISFLPLAHMLERCCENAMYYAGAAVGFYSGEIKNLGSDLKALRPTVMPAVPRLLNRVYDKLQAELAHSPIRRLLFNMGLKSKKKELVQGIYAKNSVWDKLVFKRVQESFGGNLRLMVVGSAPLAGNVLTFARCALGCIICEGYGQTECTAPISLTIYGEFNPDHVGPPVASNCVKLVDAPEMDYYCHQNQGEICVKGTNLFLGYYKEPERTMAVVDEDGWHHTGDIGMWLPNGTLKIIDRRKHIFKLSQGEYIVPEKIEAIYLRSQYVGQVFVYGESLKVNICSCRLS